MLTHRTIGLLAAVVVGASLLISAAPVRAASFTVNSTLDEVDASPGDGQCQGSSGACTLRAAIMEANALPGPDTVSVPAGVFVLTLVGAGEDGAASGDLDITSDVTIRGAGPGSTIVDGNLADRVMDVRIVPVPPPTAPSATLSGLTVRNGRAGGGGGTSPPLPGGDLPEGGGIRNRGTLHLQDVEITDNAINPASGFGRGGGIYTAGTATLTNVTISGNTSATAFESSGGAGLVNDRTATLTNVTISGNSATGDSPAGGIGNYGCQGSPGGTFCSASLTLINVTVANNTGFGIFANRARAMRYATATLKNSIVANNTAGDCDAAMSSQGHNVDGDGSCGLFAPGDLPDVDPLLGPLADNGGPTRTHAPLAGSPAIDNGDGNACPGADQRGLPRPRDGNGDGASRCDTGAVEVQSPLPTPAADLALTMADAPDPGVEGQALSYTITVTNNGPAAAPVVSIDDTLPSGATFASATVSQGRCQQGSIGPTGPGGAPPQSPVKCSLGSLAAGARATVVLVVRPAMVGSIENMATLTTSAADANLENNTASQTTVVVPRSSLTLAVNSTLDEPDAAPGDGICAAANGACTLRAALMEANASAALDTITLPTGTYLLTFRLPPGSPLLASLGVTADVTLIGAGAAGTLVDGDGVNGLVIVESTRATISKLTIRNGAGIDNRGTLVLEDAVVSGNRKPNGGGLFNLGGATLTNVTLVDNVALGTSGGSSSNPGTSGSGGGIHNRGALNVTNATIANNSTRAVLFPGIGGGISNAGTMTLTNVTVSGNGDGGGIAAGSASLTNVTISGNKGDGLVSPGGGGTAVQLKNTILANTQGGPNCRLLSPVIQQTIVSEGHNLSSDTSCPFAATGDVQNADPKLGPLTDNGGATPTHALLSGSPAIDRGTNAGCSSADQRGTPMPQDGDGDGRAVCDLGAYEAPPGTTPPPPTPTPTACSPRPKVTVSARPDGAGQLRVTVAATTNPGLSNRLRELRIGDARNAVIEASGQALTGNTTLPIPDGAQSFTFQVRRASAGQAVQVPLTVVDECGQWPTFVGGGPTSF